jgi:hypothetical protein
VKGVRASDVIVAGSEIGVYKAIFRKVTMGKGTGGAVEIPRKDNGEVVTLAVPGLL